MNTTTYAPRLIKALKVWAVEDEAGNRALNPVGTWTRYKSEAGAQRRATALNAGIGTDRAGQHIIIRTGVPVGGLGRIA